MKNVLMISYYFPPLGLGGVQRPAKFTKYLSQFGWNPTVLTVKPVTYYGYDPTLLDELRHAEIIRTGSLDPLRIFRWRRSVSSQFGESVYRKFSNWIFVPDSKVLWLPFAIATASRSVTQRKIKAVWTTAPPYSSHLVGLWLKRCKHCVWVADFRDDWPITSSQVPTSFHQHLHDWLLKQVLSHADRFTIVSQRILSRLHQKSQRPKDHFLFLPNGFDPEDFENQEVSKRKNAKCTFLYCGTLNPIHSPEAFLKGLGLALQRAPQIRFQIRVLFLGKEMGIDLETLISQNQLEGCIERLGYRPHRESIQKLMEADVLLLFLPSWADSGILTGKIYEYLASGKPILAIVPEGEASALIQRFKRGKAVDPENPELIAKTIIQWVNDWKEGKLRIGMPRWEGLEIFDRRVQTQKLAFLLDSLLSREF